MAGNEVEAVLAVAGGTARSLMDRVEQRLAELADGHPGELGVHVRDAVSVGGKRLRPLLAVVAAGPQPTDPAAVVRAACAVELIHAATLVHDDVIDQADVRRGIPTVAAAGGREMAVAVGDFLFAIAFGELVENGSKSVQALARAGSDLARGELLQRADAWRSDVTEERYLLRCQLKTARLFEAAAQLGAIAAGQDPQPCERFARSVGVAFQLLDDVLDVTGPTERTGKPRGADLLDGTVTLPWILAARKDPSLLQVKLNSLDVDAALELCERIEATGSLEQVRAQARVMTDEARASADLLESPTAEAFHLIATAMVERSA